MHSRIIQVSKNPIHKDDWIDEDRYIDGFVGSIADYVDGDTDRTDDIEWLENILGEAAKFNGDNFTIVDKENYFKKKYDAFMETLNVLQSIELDEFMGEEIKFYPDKPLFQLMYELKRAYSDKYGIYIDDNDEYAGNQTLDEFMRQTTNGDTFYIGATIDYHS